MELNFLYNDGNHLKKISFNATEITDQTFLMSQVGGFRDGTKNVGWCPKINNATFRSTEPRYFGTTGYRSQLMDTGVTGDYSRFFPTALVTAINKFPAENTYTLTTSSNFLGTKPAGAQYYNGVPLLREVDGAYKKVCNLLWAYKDQPIPGQSIHSYIDTGFITFSYPSDEFPNSSMYNPSVRNEIQFSGELPEIRMSLWVITVQDDIQGSVSYGREFKLFAQVNKAGTGSSFVSFIDLRLLNGVDEEGQPTPNGSDPKKNSTPNGWGGKRNPASSHDEITGIPAGMDTTVNWGAHGIFLYTTTRTELSNLSNILWSDDLIQKFKDTIYSPASGIIAIHKVPFTPHWQSQNPEPIRVCGMILENVPTGGYGSVGGAITPNIETTTARAIRINRGWQLDSKSIYVEPFFDSFLDFEPYTQISIRLPFVGTVAIPTNTCMGGYIKVNYLVDCLNGNCVAQVYAKSMRNIQNPESDGYQLIGQYSSNCALPMAITGNSMGGQAQVGAIAGFASNAAGSIIQGVTTGNAVGAVGGLAQSAVDLALSTITAPKDTKIIGTLSSGSTPMTDLTCRVMITRPFDVVPGEWKNIDGQIVFSGSELLEQAGLESFSGGKVNQYSGMTKGFILGNVEGATAEEMNAIKASFAGGVIV